ncbi:MAG: PQQ-binding-like beta-propeller repeat protein, partial [Planctomycetota bacterium]|nr:PQQ-binding-like beta-propeller repeat protein [Planctomycetota bacterium]
PGEGHGSPVVAGNSIFLATCLPETQERVLVCLDRQSGKILWHEAVVKSPLEVKHNLNSHASGTPAVDNDTVYVAFLEIDGSTAPAKNVGTPRPLTPGKIVVAAYDLAGHKKWVARPGDFSSVHGFCSNPVLFENLVIINGDHDGESYIAALDRETGKTVWKEPRAHQTRSYVTPLIREVAGRTQLVFSGSKSIVSLDPRTGKPHWTIDGPTEQFVASMVFDGEHFFMAAGFPTYHVLAIRPDGNGNVSESHVDWHVKNVACYVPSPVVIGNFLYVADDRGTANCFDTKTGKRHWQARLGTHYSASLASVQGKAWFIDDDGVTKLIEPGEELKVVAENTLGETVYSSPAFAQGSMFLRGSSHLYRIGESKSSTSESGR